jgi:hypothetical protein
LGWCLRVGEYRHHPNDSADEGVHNSFGKE